VTSITTFETRSKARQKCAARANKKAGKTDDQNKFILLVIKVD
jgi:hypothetical protein